MKKKVIIIGAGIAGIAAGSYALMNGMEPTIFEMHDIPGGLCTSWKRKGYIFDGCIHWLFGAKPGSIFFTSWNEIGALKGKELKSFDYTMVIETKSGKNITLYSDANRLEKHLLDISPEDENLIKDFTNAIRDFGVNKQDSKYIAKFMGMDKSKFLNSIKNPILKEAFAGFQGPFAMIFSLAFYNQKDAFYPIGGSLNFAKGIENHYKSLGGVVNYKSKVKNIIVENNCAAGVTLTNGSTYKADYVISAADGYTTLFKMLGDEYLTDSIREFYKTNIPFPSSIQVSLGINYDLSNEPYSIQLKLDTPFKIGNTETSHINLRHYCYDKSLAPAGKSVVVVLIKSDYDYWENLYLNKSEYNSKKEHLCSIIQEAVEKRFPNARGKIEIVDVATPLTYNRYTGVYKGGYMGWLNSSGKIPDSIPNLKNFYMAGQWTGNLSGLPTALMTAKGCIQKIVDDEA